MNRVTTVDLMLIDDLFEGEPGYVLDFSNKTFERFFARELNVEIYSDAYSKHGTSKANRLRCYLQAVDGKVAAQALKVLWEYRDALHKRFEQVDKVTDARARLFDLIRKLEGGQPAATGEVPQKPRVDNALLEQLGRDLVMVSGLPPQQRGYAFEKFLKGLFDAYGMAARGSFRLVGEQIDGSLVLSNEPYLLEARWQNAQTDAADLRAFNAKAEDKAIWTRGLFISQSGFTEQGLQAFGRGKRLICMDGLDLFETLNRGLHLQDVLLAKVRRAGETGVTFVRVRDLFPE